MQAASSVTVVVSNDIHCAYYAFLLIQKMQKNTALTSSWPGKALATSDPTPWI
jgi:hypothetical protein